MLGVVSFVQNGLNSALSGHRYAMGDNPCNHGFLLPAGLRCSCSCPGLGAERPQDLPAEPGLRCTLPILDFAGARLRNQTRRGDGNRSYRNQRLKILVTFFLVY